MAINFPSDRSELGYAPGPLQAGDVWVNNRVQYIWFTSPDGSGAWSAKGVNINPTNYINKAESFPADIDGSYNTGFNVDAASFATNAGTATVAGKVAQPLKLTFTSADGTVTNVNYDGSLEKSISFSDTDIASQQLNVTNGFGIQEIDPNINEISVDDNAVRAWSFAASGGSGGTSENYACEYDAANDLWRKLKAYVADGALYLGGLPADAYATRTYVDNQITTGGTNVNLDSVLLNQANNTVTGSYAEIKLEHLGSYIDLDTNRTTVNGEALPARFDISHTVQNPDGSTTGSRSLVTSEGQITIANTVDPYLILRGRRTNNNFGFASIGLDVPPNTNGFLRQPQAGDGTLNISAAQIKIRTLEHPDGFFLGQDNSGGNGNTPTPIADRVPDDIRNFYQDTDALDYAPALKRAITANGACYIPRGSFACSTTATITATSAHIYGDGSGQSMLSFASGQGLSFTDLRQLDDWDTITIKGITVSGAGNGTGINIAYSQSLNSAQKVFCEDVTVQDFDTGWNLIDTDNSTYNACSALDCITGIDCQSGTGDAVNIRFNNWQIADCTTGVNIDTRAEGVYLTDSLVINCTTGVYFKGNTGNAGAAEPYFVLRGNNIDCVTNSLIMEACIQASITDNSFYKRQNTDGDWIGIRIFGNSYDNVFSNNIFNGMTRASGPSKTGVSIERLAHSTFSNNHFLELNAAYNISWVADVNACSFVDNDYRELDVVIPTPTNGKTLNVNLIERNHLVKEKGLDNNYHILNGNGVYIYDGDNNNGFRLTPDTGGGGGRPDVETYGADTHWDDLNGGTDAAKFGDFVVRVNSGSASSLFVPGGKDIILTQQYTFNNKVAFVGPSAALGSDLPGIVCSHNGAIGIHAPNGIRARNFKFDGGSKSDPNLSPTVLVFAGGNNNSGNQDDTDSSFRRCEFGTKAGGYALQINGRNANIGDCAFSDLTNGATCVKLEWRGIQPDSSDGSDAQLETSWRKNRIYDNQFHTNNGTTAIEVDGQYEIRGLIISDNIVDVGSIFLTVKGAGVQGLTFTGNTWYGRRNGERGVIKFESGAIRSATISGNTFSGFEDGTSTPTNFIRVSSTANVRGLAITGNGFSYCDNRAISLDDPGDATRTTVVGNTFIAVNGGGAAFTDGCENAANIITTS